jgi:hypothetical protein
MKILNSLKLMLWLRWWWLWRPICWFKGHNWHELYDPDGRSYYKSMCSRCVLFTRKPKTSPEDLRIRNYERDKI